MKYLMFSFFSLQLFFSAFPLKAQDIPNAAMENWIKYVVYEEPQHWTTPNQATSPLLVFSVNKEATDVHSGDYAARLESIPILGGQAVVPGFMTIGGFEVNTSTMEHKLFGGIPFSKRPLRLKGYNKYWPQANDKWFISVSLFKHDSILQEPDTVGIGFYESGLTDSVWTPFEVYINYWSQDDPDSMNIVILTSNSVSPPAGSLLLIDSLWFDYETSSVPETQNDDRFELYPNPSSNLVFIKQARAGKSKVIIHNLYGQKVHEQTIFEPESIIEMGQLPKGIYTLSCISHDGITQKKLVLK
ncbi:MAG: PCMD domain-containing protein [Bacteroidetes bacterium]|nr:PCMD domain-containing protein [Bacteroidota bacterium]MBL6962858.1 PCMD domain-containing protein [Bacteroidota bacterium]